MFFVWTELKNSQIRNVTQYNENENNIWEIVTSKNIVT